MNAEIKKGSDDGFGLLVTDSNGVEHKIGVCYDGQIDGHLVEEYSDDPAIRSHEETEHGNQARRLAKWHVYRERGYDTLAPAENPDRLVAAMMAILDQPPVTVEHYFGELEAQLLRHRDGSVDHVPFDIADSDDMVVYRKNIWITPDPTDADPPMLEQFCQYVESPLETLDDILGEGPDPRESLPEYEIEAVSDVHYLHNDGHSTEAYPTEQPLDRDPDARIELLAIDPSAFDSFEQLLVSHLGNQIRDRFLEMGLEPPEPFQTPGLGTHSSMLKQQLLPMYDRHFLASDAADVWDQDAGKP